jgi:hypothetical protein
MNYQKHRLHENVKYEKLQQQAKKINPHTVQSMKRTVNYFKYISSIFKALIKSESTLRILLSFLNKIYHAIYRTISIQDNLKGESKNDP